MSNVFGKKLYTGPTKRANCHFSIESQTKYAVDIEAERLQTSRNWLVNHVLRRALIMREIEVKVPEEAA